MTKRVDTDESEWAAWNWKTEGDIMVNGAFFVPSGEGREIYAKATSIEPRSAMFIDQLTRNAGVMSPNGLVLTTFIYCLLFIIYYSFNFCNCLSNSNTCFYVLMVLILSKNRFFFFNKYRYIMSEAKAGLTLSTFVLAPCIN